MKTEAELLAGHTTANADLFKALGHPARVRVLEVLATRPWATIAELAAETGVKNSHLSQHLTMLRRNRLVSTSRETGQLTYQLGCPEVNDLLAAARALLHVELDSVGKELREAADVVPVVAPSLVEPVMTRSAVERAIAVLQERESCSRDDATRLLLEAALSQGLPLKDAAAHLLAAAP